MKNTIATVGITILFSLSVNHAAACETPNAPDAPSAKPSLPICMSSYKSTGKHDCSSTEAENYIDAINKYMKKLNTYAADAITYANAVQQFAKCSAEEAKEGLK
jgi:exo-beta-1,3-glucanase (GH17 family)